MILHHQFTEMAKKYGSKNAIIDRTRESEVAYSKALIAALILSKRFSKFPEKNIGVMVPTSAGAMLSVIGLLMTGKTPAMINYSTGAAGNCAYAQEKCGFETIITSRALLEKIKCDLLPGMICLEDIMDEIKIGEKLSAALRSKLPLNMLINTFEKTEIDDNAVILFTSGSEKEPKAVQLTHKNIGSNLEAIMKAFPLSAEDTILSILPLFHVFGVNTNFWLPLTQGMTAVTYANPLDYKTIPKLIKEYQVTMITGTPIFFSGYLRESTEGDFASIRFAVAGADKTPDSLREGYLKKHNLDLLEGYGATETSPVVSVNRPDRNRPGSIGEPLDGVQVRITDVETGKALGPNQEGKILVKGDLVMKGYYDDLEETSLHIRDGWYDTGDMGVLDNDGYLWHRGRLKRFVKIGGEMVSLVRTESVLQKLLPSHIDCCVVDVPDAKKGAKLAVAVTKKVDEKAIIKELGKDLPPIAIPSTFVVLDELPKMGTGKADFRTATKLVRDKLHKG
ncbi:AMP-binding protein [bacterium]|nr:AMP-binding protein [bacterium]